ncbi:MAG: GTP-binding protein [Methylococcales bacterium]|nr:GTP-binding protein [Methylococcales bacterium]
MTSTNLTRPIPVTVLSGFLGSGKTTLLNRLLAKATDAAVIINEFGETPIDPALLDQHNIPLTTLSGGCLCCQVRGALAPMLKNLRLAYDAKQTKPFQRVFIETSGVASPEPILDTLLNERWLRSRYHYQGLITTVSALAAGDYLQRFPEALAQIAWADKLLLTHADIADTATVTALRQRLNTLAPATPIHESAEPAQLLAFGQLLRPQVKSPAGSVPEHGFRSVVMPFEYALNWQKLSSVLTALLNQPDSAMVRIKGVLRTDQHVGMIAVHGIPGTLFPPTPLPERDLADRRGRLVLITTGDTAPVVEYLKQALS